MAYANNILFEVLSNILQKKSGDVLKKHLELEDFEKQFPRYMVLRYLSMCGDPAVQKLICENQIALERFPNSKTLYEFLLKAVPKQKSGFVKYIKQ